MNELLASKSLKTWGIIVLVLVVIWGIYSAKSVVKPDSNTYQALFLTNGQVYFGKLTAKRSQYVIRDVFYIQAFDPKKTEQQIKLVKFGEELHGPEDMIVIERSQVSVWENLKPNSRVIQGILAYKTRGPDPVPAPAAPAPAPSKTGAKKK
jgi:hypothetical protein